MSDTVLSRITIAILLLLLGLAMVFVIPDAFAHDHSHQELNDWFKGLKSSGHGMCCDGSDAMHLDNVDWNTQIKEGSHFRVKVPKDSAGFAAAMRGDDPGDLVWVDVPDDAVITDEPNKAGMTLVWPTYYSIMGEVMIRCFMPGSMT